MNTNQDVATRRPGEATNAAGDSTSTQERPGADRDLAVLPAVDIFEDPHQLTVQAEMPGVSKDTLKVQADRDSLLIEGSLSLNMPSGMSALYADVQATTYRRTFTLSTELDTERISASLKDGLLTVRIPKRSEYRTRKIKVDVS